MKGFTMALLQILKIKKKKKKEWNDSLNALINHLRK